MGVSFNKPIRVSCPIPFKSQVRFVPWRVAIMMANFPSVEKERFTREETDLLVCEVKVCEQKIYGDNKAHVQMRGSTLPIYAVGNT